MDEKKYTTATSKRVYFHFSIGPVRRLGPQEQTWSEDPLVKPDSVDDRLRRRREAQHVQPLVPFSHDGPKEHACGCRVSFWIFDGGIVCSTPCKRNEGLTVREMYFNRDDMK